MYFIYKTVLQRKMRDRQLRSTHEHLLKIDNTVNKLVLYADLYKRAYKTSLS